MLESGEYSAILLNLAECVLIPENGKREFKFAGRELKFADRRDRELKIADRRSGAQIAERVTTNRT